MEKKDKPQVYNENHMENCNVFQGDIYGATFPLPGAQRIRGTGTSIHAFMCLKNVCK